MKREITTLIALLIILIGKTEAVTLTQKVGDGVAKTEIIAGEHESYSNPYTIIIAQ